MKPLRVLGRAVRARVLRAVAEGRRDALAPLLLGLVPLAWVWDATDRASIATLGRDQGIFQYVAWAIRRGEVDYRDVRDVNGPLTHMVHAAMLALGGGDEHRFRVLDLTTSAIVFALFGAALPGLALRIPRSRGWIATLAWAFAACVVLLGQYAQYSYWDQAQRESFCDWFAIGAVALLTARWTTQRAARARVLLAGALGAIACSGKPTYAAFSVAALVSLAWDDEVPLSRARRIATHLVGCTLGALVPLVFMVRHADLATYVRIVAHDVPEVYRFIWAKSAREIFGDEAALVPTAVAVAASALTLGAVATRALPRRALVIATFPIAGVTSVLAQQKGFSYHFHPVTAGTFMCALALLAMLCERHVRTAARRSASLGVLGLCCALGWYVATSLRTSPNLQNVWVLALGETAEKRSQQEYFDRYRSDHFDPWNMRLAARLVRDHTRPADRVQTYGMDPYLLFLAERRSASPYIYAYDLDAAAALGGGWHNEPTEAQAARISAARDAHERDLLEHLSRSLPAAFVLMDHAPLMAYRDALDDLHNSCPDTAALLDREYAHAGTFGIYRVYFRSDLTLPEAGPPKP